MSRVPAWARWVAVAVVAAAILVAATVPAVPARVPRGPLGLVGADKWVHALGFAAFALTLGFALASTRLSEPAAVAAAVLVAVLYGAGIEVIQLSIPTRRFDTGDLLADAVGATVAVAAWRVAARLRRRRTHPAG